MRYRCFWLLPLILMTAPPGRAQTGKASSIPAPVPPGSALPLPTDLALIHLDSPVVPRKAALDTALEVRAFGGDEGITYTSLGVQYGFGSSWGGVLRGTFSGRKNFSLPGGTAAIRHGGNDIELAARYQSLKDPRFAGLIGVSFPSTAAQNDPVITLGASAAFPLGKSATAYLNPKTVLLKNNLLLGLGIGVRARLSDGISLIADVTPLLSGRNTRSTHTGSRERRSVYGIALRIAHPDKPLSLDLGYASGTGRTTGSSLTAGLGGSGAFYAGLTLRR